MNKMNKLRASEIYKNTSLSLILIVSVDHLYRKTGFGCYLHGNIESIALIVSDTEKIYALDMEANPVSIDRLKQAIPELKMIFSSRELG